jgi:hypothetical protein
LPPDCSAARDDETGRIGTLWPRHDDGQRRKTGQAEFLGVGKGFRVIITSRTPGKYIGFATIDDGKYEDGKWIPARRLNGDETDQGGAWRFDPRAIHTEKATLYRY